MKVILLDRDFTQKGQLHFDKMEDPVITQDASTGEHSLRFDYPMQEHQRYVNTLRIYAGKTLGDLGYV